MRHLPLAPDQEGYRERLLYIAKQLSIAIDMVYTLLADVDQGQVVVALDPDANVDADANVDQADVDAEAKIRKATNKKNNATQPKDYA